MREGGNSVDKYKSVISGKERRAVSVKLFTYRLPLTTFFCFLLLTAYRLPLTTFLSAAEVLQEIVVKEGDTLWGIAETYLQDPKRWPEILKHNNLPVMDPAVALPGMKLKVPVQLIKEHLRKAVLIFLLNEVRYRKRDQAAWKKALLNMELYNEDGLRTMEKSQAQVKFHSGDILKLDENSLVILRPELKIEEINLLSGALRSSRAKVITPTVEITPQSKETVYKARVRDDQATIVQVEKGSAEVFGLDTKQRVVLQAGFANITLPRQAPGIPVKAPPLPEFKTPEFSVEGKILLPENVPWPSVAQKEINSPRIEIDVPALSEYQAGKEKSLKGDEKKAVEKRERKSWQAYRIVIAKDSKFNQIVWEEKKALGTQERITTDAKEYNLTDGRYYRGISYFDENGKESEIKNLGSFEIDTQSPKIILFSPQEGFQTREPLVTIEGQTEPKSFVTVNNFAVGISPEGKFSFPVILAKEGANKIKVVVRDKGGNLSELERTIYLLGGR